MAYIRNDGGRYRRPDRPFALFVAMNPPHPPFHEVPQRFRSFYSRTKPIHLLNRQNVGRSWSARRSVTNYFASVTGIDEEFGRILSCLDEEGLTENTIVVFTADHGEMMGSHGLMGKGGPYEESIGIPFIIRWPGMIPARQWDLLLGVPDVMPTLISLIGLDKWIPKDVQGSDLSAGFLGEAISEPESAFYIHRAVYMPPHLGNRGVRTKTHTYALIREADDSQRAILFDNEADPYQMNNLAGTDTALQEHLDGLTYEWLEKTEDPWLTGG